MKERKREDNKQIEDEDGDDEQQKVMVMLNREKDGRKKGRRKILTLFYAL